MGDRRRRRSVLRRTSRVDERHPARGCRIYKSVRALARGKLRTGSTAVWDLRNGGVGLGKISPSVPLAFRREIDRIRAQIIAGKIAVPSALD